MRSNIFIIRAVAISLFLSFLLASCAPRPACKTAWGKKKLKYYNSIQYN